MRWERSTRPARASLATWCARRLFTAPFSSPGPGLAGVGLDAVLAPQHAVLLPAAPGGLSQPGRLLQERALPPLARRDGR